MRTPMDTGCWILGAGLKRRQQNTMSPNRESQITNRQSAIALRILLLVALAAPALADEAIFLQTGEEYRGTLERIADGKAVCRIAGKERAFDLAAVQRIEFQRRRKFDDVTTAAALPDLPVFRAVKHKTADLRRRFPQAGHVVLLDSTRIRIEPDGRYTIDRVEAWRILHERGARSAMRALHYFADRQKAQVVYGLTVAPDGAVSRVADSAMKDEAVYSRLPAYNFRHRFRFTLRGAVPGATLVLATRVSGTASLLEPLVLDRVFWGSEPALTRDVRLVASDAAMQRLSIATANGLAAGGKGVWVAKDTPQVFPEPLMPPTRAFAPRLVLAWPKATWPDIAAAFRKRLRAKDRLRIKAETARALFDHVRTQLRIEGVPLDALPDGPAPPSAVLKRSYGNETERALLLAALLRGAGAKAHTMLVRDRDDGPLLPTAPRLRGFNRAVVKTTDTAGNVVWLQADDIDRGFGELAPNVQGAQGLDLATGQIVTVPVRAPKTESLRRKVDVTLAPDGTATVRDVTTLRGRYAKAYRGLKDLTDADLQKWAARYVGRDRTGVALVSFDHTALGDANAEERLTFVYRVPALATAAGKFLLLELPNAAASATDVGRSQRERALFWDGPEREDVAFVVRAPKGYKVYALADGLAAKGAGWSEAATFEADAKAPDIVRFRDVWERSAIAAPRAAYAAYRAARIRRSRLRGEVIVFVRK